MLHATTLGKWLGNLEQVIYLCSVFLVSHQQSGGILQHPERCREICTVNSAPGSLLTCYCKLSCSSTVKMGDSAGNVTAHRPQPWK